MLKPIKTALALTATLGLAACQTTGLPGASTTSSLFDYNALNDTVTTAAAAGLTGSGTVPTNATYTGMANVTIGTSTAPYIGDMALSVDFAGGTFGGTIDSFDSYADGADPTTATGTPVAGALALSGTYGDVFGLAWLTGTASGTVDGTTGTSTASGNFYGTDADFVQVNAFGDFGVIAVGQKD